jgi:mannose-1-phosphate guanylyltransferase
MKSFLPRFDSLAAIILAGGNGTRLSSLTRAISGRDIPKQFCPLLGDQTPLEQTRRRAALVVPASRTVTVLTRAHQTFYRPLLADACDCNLVVQPDNRDTAPAILYALLRLIRLGHRDSVAIFPSDHYVSDDRAFMRHVEAAYQATLLRPQRIVLLGLKANAPETQYGWIEPSAPIDFSRTGLPGVSPVRRFWEKPDLELARTLWRGGCLWNSMVIVASTTALVDVFARGLPRLYSAFASLLPRLNTPAESDAISQLYSCISSSNFSDTILAEHPGHLDVLPVCGVEWNDLGEPSRVMSTIGQLGIRPKWAATMSPA